MTVNIYNSIDTVTTLEKKEIIDFLHKHLEGYDERWHFIENAVNYALNPNPAFGGFVLYIRDENKMIGSLVMNKTRMKDYIPENQLVYLAVHKHYKDLGIEQELLDNAIRIAKGNISMHVKSGDPAINLYKKYGFDNIYMEMRYINSNN